MAAAVIGIDHDLDRQMFDLAAQLIGMMTQDNDGSTYPALPDHTDDAFDKLLPLDGQQRLGTAHATGLARGKNNGDDHAYFVVDLLVDFVDKPGLLQFAYDAVVDDILDAQSSAGLSRQRLFDLHLGSFTGNQWDTIVQLHVGGPG